MRSNLIIVVDDDDELRSLLSEILEADSCRVLDFPSPHGALQGIHSGSVHHDILSGAPPIIISDNLMPGGMSGLDFLKEVRKEHPSIPFILMTAFGSDEIFKQSKELGATSFLKKPFSLTDVFEHLARARAAPKKAAGVERGFG